MCVVAGEVDRLGDLRIGLIERLARLGRHHLGKLRATLLKGSSDPVEDAGAFRAAARAPDLAVLGRGGEDRIELFGHGERVGGQRVES